MIGALIALLSLDLTAKLVAAGVVAKTLTVIAATNATPIVLTTSAAHRLTRPAHGVVSGVGGNASANGAWVLTPTGATTLRLSTFTGQGTVVNSVGSGSYSSGGTVEIAFPDGSILLGRRNVALNMAMASPRIVFVPVGSPTWELDPYGGVISAPTLPVTQAQLSAEQKTMALKRQLCTERQQFEVHVTGCSTPPDPDFGDFDVTQALYHELYVSMFELITPARARVIGGHWESQDLTVGQQDVRGQKWRGLVEISQPVVEGSLTFAPIGVTGELVVNFEDGSSADQTIIVVAGS